MEFGLGRVLEEREVHTDLGWVVFVTVDLGPVEGTSFDLGVPLVQEGQPYVREICLEVGTRPRMGSLPLWGWRPANTLSHIR